jgi:hypothetical protein
MTQVAGLQLTTTSEYTNYVHTYATGNYTVVEKPIFPVAIANSQIPIGGNWTIVCPLQAGHNYHVYLYGAWVTTSSSAKTNYDLYVYDPNQNLESSQTESAGIPEHLGTTDNGALFTPMKSGNYSFEIRNNKPESKGSQPSTFMIIENLDVDKWYTSKVEGTDDNNMRGFYTTWSYEFVTNASKVELYIKVPETLDMYEARLYLMNNAKSPSIDSFPLSLETGLYGTVTGSVGGYNFESDGYRGVAYASCGYAGQPMFLNYTSPNKGVNLYQLVLIGEHGSGDVQLMLKTQLGKASLTSLLTPSKVYPNSTAEISCVANSANLENAQLSYTTDNWASTSNINMTTSNQTCKATIPIQKAGLTVQYKVDATDLSKNTMKTTGNYAVKNQPTFRINAANDTIIIGGNITISGTLTPNNNLSRVNVQFFSANSTQTLNCLVNDDGTFSASYKPVSLGVWAVSATSPETKTSWKCFSSQLAVTVNEPGFIVKYSLFIIIGVVVAAAVGGVVYFLKFRGK